MNNYIVLLKGDNLPRIYDYIKEVSNGWWKHMPSSIIVMYTGAGSELRDNITEKYGADIEKIVVLKLEGTGAWRGIKESGSQWIKNNL